MILLQGHAVTLTFTVGPKFTCDMLSQYGDYFYKKL